LFTSKPKSVFILTDEGLQIFYVTPAQVHLVITIDWKDPDFFRLARHAVIKNCKKSPILILNDMVEQHYRKENLPQIGGLDKKNILKRRLNVAFPNYPVRAALKLSSKYSQSKPGTVPYLFSAISLSEQLESVLNIVEQTGVKLIGVHLLPVESTQMIKNLRQKIRRAGGKKPLWTIFIGQHQNGNVRQIVTRHDDLALTRLTPIVDTDIEPDLWSHELSTEIDATMGYLTRFGYKESDGLDIIIVANDKTTPFLEEVIKIPCNLHILNAAQLSQALRTPIGKQDDLRYADYIHAAYQGRQNKFILPLDAPIISQLIKPRKIAGYILLFLLFVFLYLAFNGFQTWQQTAQTKEDLAMTQEKNRSLQEELDKEFEKEKAAGFDFALVNSAIQIDKKLTDNKPMPLPIIQGISGALDENTKIDKIIFEQIENKQQNDRNQYSYNIGNTEQEPPKISQAVVTLSFLKEVLPEVGVQKVNKLARDIQEKLPNYNVEIIKQIADLSYTGNFVGGDNTADDASKKDETNSPEFYTAEIAITEIQK